jgi:hypothetical protein
MRPVCRIRRRSRPDRGAGRGHLCCRRLSVLTAAQRRESAWDSAPKRLRELGLIHRRPAPDPAAARLGIQLLIRRALGAPVRPLPAPAGRGHVPGRRATRCLRLPRAGTFLVHRARRDLLRPVRALTALLRARLDVLILPLALPARSRGMTSTSNCRVRTFAECIMPTSALAACLHSSAAAITGQVIDQVAGNGRRGLARSRPMPAGW